MKTQAKFKIGDSIEFDNVMVVGEKETVKISTNLPILGKILASHFTVKDDMSQEILYSVIDSDSQVFMIKESEIL